MKPLMFNRGTLAYANIYQIEHEILSPPIDKKSETIDFLRHINCPRICPTKRITKTPAILYHRSRDKSHNPLTGSMGSFQRYA